MDTYTTTLVERFNTVTERCDVLLKLILNLWPACHFRKRAATEAVAAGNKSRGPGPHRRITVVTYIHTLLSSNKTTAESTADGQSAPYTIFFLETMVEEIYQNPSGCWLVVSLSVKRAAVAAATTLTFLTQVLGCSMHFSCWIVICDGRCSHDETPCYSCLENEVLSRQQCNSSTHSSGA